MGGALARELDFQRVTVRIFNHFEGPNFVNGLAKQTASYTVVSDTLARLEFAGGFDGSVTYVQRVHGTGFGIDASGRYTGFVDSYRAFEKGDPANGWSFEGLDTSLDRLNTLASDPGVTFEDLLLIPLEYDFVGARFDDVFICGSFDDIAHGLAGADEFNGLSGDDRLFGDAGPDLLTGGDGDDGLRGGSGADLILGGDGADAIFAGRGGDAVRGGMGADMVRGGAGDDRVRGAAGSDAIFGGAGDDRVRGGDGADALAGGGDRDRLLGEAGGDVLEGGSGADRLAGGGGTNFLFGQPGDDALRGGGGSDELFGGTGADRLASGSGADFVIGGAGDDRLSANAAGGAGDKAVDTFIFEAAFGTDVVTDFEVGFDGLLLAAGITADEVTTAVVGDDVLVRADVLGGQTILVEAVAGRFDPAIDIQFV
jgi:Ca2+-binding RTX toxin-like protein